MCAELHQRVAMPTLLASVFIYHKVVRTSLSHLEAHEGFFRLYI